ncbi:MAG TPA: hypothetical protein PKE29_13395 [Phycisphaerales bacterium]|nr:hypothetical protein [Phycisphaerales bacterium]
MADLLFTIGADDRAFHQSLARIERTSASAAKSVGRIFGIGSTVMLARQAIHYLKESVDAYGKSSEAAGDRVRDMQQPWKDLQVVIGETTTGYVESFNTEIEKALGNVAALVGIDARGFATESREAHRAKRIQDERIKGEADVMRLRRTGEADFRELFGDKFGAERLREMGKHETRLREIGAIKGVPNDEKAGLRDLENARFGLLGRLSQLEETKDIRDRWLKDRQSEKFTVLENANVADATTRGQIIGTGGFGMDFNTIYRNAQRDLMEQGRKQLEALRAVEANTRGGRGAKFQP